MVVYTRTVGMNDEYAEDDIIDGHPTIIYDFSSLDIGDEPQAYQAGYNAVAGNQTQIDHRPIGCYDRDLHQNQQRVILYPGEFGAPGIDGTLTAMYPGKMIFDVTLREIAKILCPEIPPHNESRFKAIIPAKLESAAKVFLHYCHNQETLCRATPEYPAYTVDAEAAAMATIREGLLISYRLKSAAKLNSNPDLVDQTLALLGRSCSEAFNLSVRNDIQPLAMARLVLEKLGYSKKMVSCLVNFAAGDNFSHVKRFFEKEVHYEFFSKCILNDDQPARLKINQLEGELFEMQVKNFLTASDSLRLKLVTSTHNQLKPDILIDQSTPFLVKGLQVHWIEVKSFMGGVSDLFDDSAIQQCKKYTEHFGCGALLYKLGCTATFAVKLKDKCKNCFILNWATLTKYAN